MTKRPSRAVLLVASISLALCGCASDAGANLSTSADASTSSTASTSANKEVVDMTMSGNWVFVSLDGQAMAESHRPATLGFDDKRAFGSTGCNQFSGGYNLSGDMLQMQPLAMTRKACIGAVSAQESLITALFGEPIQVALSDKGQKLTLTSASHQAELTREQGG